MRLSAWPAELACGRQALRPEICRSDPYIKADLVTSQELKPLAIAASSFS